MVYSCTKLILASFLVVNVCSTNGLQSSLRVLIAGGHYEDPTEPAYKTEILGIGTDSCLDVPNLDTTFYPTTSSAAVLGGRYTFCGNAFNKNCWYFSPFTYEWVAGSDLRESLWGMAGALVENGEKWWLTGGNCETFRKETRLINSFDGSVEEGPELPREVAMHCMVPVNSTHLFYAGGIEQGDSLTEAYFVDWTRREFTRERNMPHNGNDNAVCACFLDDQKVHFVGCSGSKDRSQYFSLKDRLWYDGPLLPGGEYYGHGSIVQNGNDVILLGGLGPGYEATDKIWEFNKNDQIWIERPERLLRKRFDHGAVVYDSPC